MGTTTSFLAGLAVAAVAEASSLERVATAQCGFDHR
jgi:hypothetical protein